MITIHPRDCILDEEFTTNRKVFYDRKVLNVPVSPFTYFGKPTPELVQWVSMQRVPESIREVVEAPSLDLSQTMGIGQ